MAGERRLARLRDRLGAVASRAAPLYGLLAGMAIAVPLLAGTLTGQADTGVIVALGAYLAAVRAPEGTYGQKARSYFVIVLFIGLGELIGGLLAGHRWAAVAAVPLLVILGTLVKRIGLTAALAAIFATIRPPGEDPVQGALLSAAGALLMTVLVLAPWPGRRLRPLTEALADAVEAVAGALDGVTGPVEEWERSRRAAADAIGRARATYGMYTTSSADDRPARLIKTIVKLLHEVVALRGLIEAESATPLHDDLKAETRAAVAVSAARTRLLAGAIANPGNHVPVDRPTPMPISRGALSRLGDRVDEARREAAEGNEDLVAAALAFQAWRSLRRLNSTIDSAARLVAAGITLKLAVVPRLPGPPDPRSWWHRVVKALRTWPPSLRYAIRAGLTILVAMGLWAGMDLPHGHWLPLATLMCLRGTYGETVSRVLERVGGTAVGSILAAVLLVISPGRPALTAIIFVLAVFGFALSPVGYLYWVVLCTPLLMMIIDFGEPVPWSVAAVRIVLTIGGSSLALAAARLLWPAAPTGQLPTLLATLLERHAEVVRATAAALGEEQQPPLVERLRPAQQAAGVVTAEADRLSHDPAPDIERISRLREAVRSAHRIRDEVITLAGMARAESAARGPVSAVLERLADRLEESAEAVVVGDREPPPLDLDDLLAELDAQLSSLVKRRRAEVEGGTHLDDTTPLRSDLLSVAAVRHAIRSLRADTEALVHAAFLVSGGRPAAG